MTNYLPTRADQLRPGDVVRASENAPEDTVASVEFIGRGFLLIYFDGDDVPLTIEGARQVLKRITDEEYEALSAPGDW